MITAVITTYKRETEMVFRALNSVLQQTLNDIEVIVVDDSPCDYPFREDVKKMVLSQKQLHPRRNIRIIQHEKNLGACAARNTGLEVAKGDYIAFLDDDDEWVPEKLEKQISLMSDPNVGLVYCGHYLQDDRTGKRIKVRTECFHGDVFKKLLDHNFIGSTSFPVIRTETIKEAGGFDIMMKSAQDYDMWLRIAKRHIIEYIDEPLVIYHTHAGEQITSNPQKKIDGLNRINEKYQEFIENDPELCWKRNIVLAPFYNGIGESRKAFSIWYKCLKKRPLKLIGNLFFLRAILKNGK